MFIAEHPQNTLDASELLARARAGDADAFCELGQSVETRLYNQAIAICRNPAEAEDLVAETLVAAWTSLHRFNGQCRFTTWLYSILLHRFYKLVRRAKSRPQPLSTLPRETIAEREDHLARIPDHEPLPGEVLLRHELSANIREAIELLPVQHQQVLLLRFYQDASLPEIAAALGIPPGTVKSRLHHALEKLRKMKSVMNLLETARDKRV